MKLYKFVQPERVDILSNECIRFSQPSDLNDPFETRPHITQISDNPNIEEVASELLSEERLRAEYEDLPESEKTGRFGNFQSFYDWMLAHEEEARELMARNNEFRGPGESRREFLQTVRTFFDDRFGILSLTEKWKSVKMWAHYAASQTGFVIEFDSDRLTEQWHGDDYGDVLGQVHEVIYSSERPEVTWQQSNHDDEEYENYLLTNFLLTKLDDWAEEEEWRVVMPFRDADDMKSEDPHNIYLFNYPTDSITGIIFGIRTSTETRNAVRRAVQEVSDISFSEVRPSEGVFSLERHSCSPE